MRRVSISTTVSCLLVLYYGMHAGSGCSNPSRAQTTVASVSFGTVQPNETISSTVNIPYKIGTEYGWLVDVTSTAPETRIKEVLELPSAANWGTPPPTAQGIRRISHTISDDGRTQTEEFAVDARSGVTLLEKYVIAEGDPQGDYKLTIFVDEQRFDFDFTVRD